MIIDATVTDVQQVGRNLVVTITPVVEQKGGWRKITIMNFTHVPRVGQAIHGTSSRVTIEPGMGVHEKWSYGHHDYFNFRELKPN